MGRLEILCGRSRIHAQNVTEDGQISNEGCHGRFRLSVVGRRVLWSFEAGLYARSGRSEWAAPSPLKRTVKRVVRSERGRTDDKRLKRAIWARANRWQTRSFKTRFRFVRAFIASVSPHSSDTARQYFFRPSISQRKTEK